MNDNTKPTQDLEELEESGPLYEKWPGPWMRRVIVLMLAVIPLMLFGLVYYRFTDAATASDQKKLQERSDCARTISNDQTTIKDAAFIAKARLDQAFVTAVVEVGSNPAKSDEARAKLSELAQELDKAIDEMESLPPTQGVVEQECPSVGK